MKIKLSGDKNSAVIDLKKKVDAKRKQFAAMQMTDDQCHAMVKEYLDSNEFESEDGHIVTMELELPSADDTYRTAKAIGDAIAKALQPLSEALTIKGKTLGVQNGVQITDQKEGWEELAAHKTFEFTSLGEFGQSVYYANCPNAGIRVTDTRLAKMAEGANKVRKALANGVIQKAAPTTFASELVGQDGGFMVPPDYKTDVWIAVRDTESMLGMTDLTPTNSDVVIWPADENTPWDNTTGITTGWRAQGATMTQSKPVLQSRQTPVNEIYALVPATEELIQDTPRLNSYLMEKAPMKIGFQVDEAIWRGTGAGQPLGFLNSASLVTTTKTTTTKTLGLIDLVNMYQRFLAPDYRNITGAFWLMTPAMYSQIVLLCMGTANTSAAYPIGLANMQIGDKILPTILGIPVFQTQHASAPASAGSVVLGDLKRGYAAFNKTSGMDFQTSMHLFFDAAAIALRWRMRIGGEPYLKAAVVPAQDTANTMSYFVAIGAN